MTQGTQGFAIEEPVRGSVLPAHAYRLSGLERMRNLVAGDLPRPPLSRLTGVRVTHVAPGSATASAPASPWTLLPDGSVDYTVLAETALVAAAITGMPPDVDVCTVSLKVQPLRSTSLQSETLVARARTVHGGRHFTFAEATIEDAAGRVVAFATASLVTSTCPLDAPGPVRDDDIIHRSPDPWLRTAPQEVFPFGVWGERPGVAVLEDLRGGQIAPVPFHHLLGIELADATEGRVTFTMPASEWFCTRSDHISPGVLGALAQITMATTALSLSPGGFALGVVDQAVSFIRMVPSGSGTLVARGRAVHVQDLAVLECEVVSDTGERVAHGHQSVKLVPHRGSAGPAPDRRLLTVLFTDIVDSTRRAEELGDATWGSLLASHQALVRRQLEIFRGHEVKTTGDGFLATFDAPGRAVQCARAIRDAARGVGLEVRAGIHTGECDVVDGDVTGIAVHVAARILSSAGPGEIVVSGVVRDLSAGSGLPFRDRGRETLRGVEGEWQLFALAEDD